MENRSYRLEHMSDPELPRIRVALPAGTSARLLGWRQDPETGQWWARIEAYAPAAAVQQVPDEDYSQVPREPAPGPATTAGYVLATDTRNTPPTLELHEAACWEISQPASWRRIAPLENTRVARASLQAVDTTACPVCTPDP